MGKARRTGTNKAGQGSQPVGEVKPEWPKRLELWALVVSIVALVWSIGGLPTFEGFLSSRTSAENYLKAIVGDTDDIELPLGESATHALTYAAPDSDAWHYAAQRQMMWSAYDAGGGTGDFPRSKVSMNISNARVCTRPTELVCRDIDNLQFDAQHRLESYTEDGVPLSSILLKAKAESYQDPSSRGIKATFKGGERNPKLGYLNVVFEVWNDTDARIKIDPKVSFRDLDDSDAKFDLVGPDSIGRGQRALYFAKSTIKNAQWLHFSARSEGGHASYTYFVPIQ